MISPVIDDNHVVDEYVDNTDNLIENHIIDDSFPHDMCHSLNKMLLLILISMITLKISLILNQENLFHIKGKIQVMKFNINKAF